MAHATAVRRSTRATRFDAAKHMDGATQHPVRARFEPANGACERVEGVICEARKGAQRKLPMCGAVLA
jgi:hypothetical protein